MKDTKSEERLCLVHPELARRVRAAAEQLEAVGTFIRVAEGLRTYERSNELYAQGRTAPGHIVTNARGGFSHHNHGLAVDCYPFLAGDTGDLNYKAGSPQFKAMVHALKTQGLFWGGDWRSIVDPPHFQLTGLGASPTDADRLCFRQGGCPAVWAHYASRIYNLQASGHEHLSLPMLLWGLAGGAAQSAGRWISSHLGRRLLTLFRRTWDNTAPAAKAGPGEKPGA